MIKIQDPSECSGCTACASICPGHCISMQPDGLGFLYPKVDENSCINCGLCEKVCAFTPDYKTPDNFESPIPYGARCKDIREVEKSRSGGIFAAISDIVLNRGGVVYGAGLDSAFRVLHKRAVNRKQRDELRGSKYVQSDLHGIFNQVAADLKNGLDVLFSGTPCQTAGLHSFLTLKKIDKSRLFVCDIVCHGVPSPYIWRDYLDYIRKKEGQDILAVNFRDKQKFGWKAHKESFKLSDTYTYTYTYTFYQHIMFRHSCGICPYTNLRRTGDITLADFWGWEKTDININKDNKGLSLIFINTPKGNEMFGEIQPVLDYILTTIDKCIQPNLERPSEMHPQRKQFEKDYIKKGFLWTMKNHALMGWKYKKSLFDKKLKGKINTVKILIKKV